MPRCSFAVRFAHVARLWFVAAALMLGAHTARAQDPFQTNPAPAPAAADPFAPKTPAATPAPATTNTDPFAPQTPTPAAPAAPGAGAPSPSLGVMTPAPAPSGGYRVLAKGVETTIPNPVTAADQTSRHDLVEVLATSPQFGVRPKYPNVQPAKNVHFAHDVWGLDFTFKPIRFLRVPGPDGKERLIWYMVYHVKNGPIKRMIDDPSKPEPEFLIPEYVNQPFLFIPHFELESYDVKQVYPEKLMPDVVPLIEAREDKNRKLLTTAQITGEIQPSTAETDPNTPAVDRSAWGVVTWEGVDPRTDRFSIYVYGLTNAYRWDDPAGAYKAGDPPGTGRTYQTQVLKLNFWRPGDAYDQKEGEIRFGIPGEVDYEWFYK